MSAFEVLPQIALAADGWSPSGETWTYASATTFTVAGVNVTEKYSRGTRVKLTQTTTKYFVVVASSFSTDTTVTITGGTDYTLANAAITSPHFSYVVNPLGYPGWFNYTPTWGGFSVSPTVTAQFAVHGRMCTLIFWPSVNGTSNANTLTMTLPIACDGTVPSLVPIRGHNNGADLTTPAFIFVVAGTTQSIYLNMAGAVWTTSGAKSAAGVVTYGI